MTVAQKLYFLMGTALLGLVMVVVVSLYQLDKTYTTTNYASLNAVPSYQLFFDVRKHLGILREYSLMHLILSGDNDIAEIEQTMNDSHTKLLQDLTLYETTGCFGVSCIADEKERKLFDDIKIAAAAYDVERLKIIDLSKKNLTKEAEIALKNNLMPAVIKMRNAVDADIDYNAVLSKAGSDAGLAAKNTATTITILLTLTTAILVAFLGWFITRGLSNMLGGEPEYAAKIANAIAECNLSSNIETRPGDKISLLAAMKTMQDSLAAIINKINGAAHRLDTSATRLAETAGVEEENNSRRHQDVNHSMAAAIEELSATVAEITSTMEEMSTSSSQIADHSNSVVNIANHTLEKSKKGADSMQQLLGRMESIRADNQDNLKEIVELGSKSKEISKIMDIINNIAGQTKLIAFNAALEASSAGEAGKRFSVVASEIRRLADSVTNSTSDIENKISEIQNSINRLVVSSEKGVTIIAAGMVANTESVTNLADLVSAAAQTSSAAQQISLSTQQQKTACAQVVVALREIVTASSHTSESVKLVSQISRDMWGMSTELSKLVGQFKLTEDSSLTR